jgi:uncharacterized protein
LKLRLFIGIFCSVLLSIFLLSQITKNLSANLISAVLENDLESLRSSLRYSSPNFANRGGESPLSVAAYSGNEAAVDLLLAAGADVNFANLSGESILMSSAFHDQLSIFDKLVKKGARLNDQDQFEQTALLWTICYNSQKVFNGLLEAGADLNLADKFGVSPAEATLHFNNTWALVQLLNKGVDPNLKTPLGAIGLIAAANSLENLKNISPLTFQKYKPVAPYYLSYLQELLLMAKAENINFVLNNDLSDALLVNALGMDAPMLAMSIKRYDVLPALLAKISDCERTDYFGKSYFDYMKGLDPKRMKLFKKNMKCAKNAKIHS